MTTLSVPIQASIIHEIILRSKGKKNITALIEDIVEDFLDRTRGDPDIWSDEHAQEVSEEIVDDTLVKWGNPSKGYSWQNVLLPNGTQLKIAYRGGEKIAEVRHQQVYFEDRPCSPSQFASRVANNTSRNAWRDIWVKRPNDRDWIFSDRLRTGEAA